MSEKATQLMSTRVAELFGIVPMKFKGSANLEHIPHQQISLFKLDTFSLVLPHASTRNRVLRYITMLSLFQYLLMTLPHGIAIVRMGKPSWKADKLCTSVGGITPFITLFPL